MGEYYKLNPDHSVTPISDPMEWARMFEDIDTRRVDETYLNDDIRVSTVFLGLDHSFGHGPPLIFETMIFGGEHDQAQWRYSTWEQAVKGHRIAVERARKALTNNL
jgi:hypothetical protein